MAGARSQVGLTDADVSSPVGEYEACQRIGSLAHQLELNGVLVPAAAWNGLTLALFTDRLSLDAVPVVVAEEEWPVLPADPRHRRLRAL